MLIYCNICYILVPETMSSFHVQSNICITLFHVWSKICIALFLVRNKICSTHGVQTLFQGPKKHDNLPKIVISAEMFRQHLFTDYMFTVYMTNMTSFDKQNILRDVTFRGNVGSIPGQYKLRFILPFKSECQPICQNSIQIFQIRFWFHVQLFQKHKALVYF